MLTKTTFQEQGKTNIVCNVYTLIILRTFKSIFKTIESYAVLFFKDVFRFPEKKIKKKKMPKGAGAQGMARRYTWRQAQMVNRDFTRISMAMVQGIYPKNMAKHMVPGTSILGSWNSH